MSKNECFFTPSIFAVNENEATLSACICNRVQPVHRHMNRMWCRQSAHREIKLHPARLSVEHLNAVIEKFPGTVITEIVKIWAENALGAGSQESCEFILPNSQVERRTQTFAPSLISNAEILPVFLRLRYNYPLSKEAAVAGSGACQKFLAAKRTRAQWALERGLPRLRRNSAWELTTGN
jgi:hypothetical protein